MINHNHSIIHFFNLFLLSAVFPATLIGQTPEPAGYEKPIIGFYKGIVLMSGHSGSIFDKSGSLLDHERYINNSLKAQALMGNAPLKILGNASTSPVFLIEQEYNNKHQLSFDIEYGFTSHIGIGISWMSTAMDTRRQEQLPLPENFTNIATGVPSFYLEVIPKERSFYRDSILLGSVSWHPVDEELLDPYIVFRFGGGTLKTAYREIYNPMQNLLNPDSAGFTTTAGIGAGINIMLTGEFGLKIEINHTKKYLRSEHFSYATLNTSALTAGVVLNWENISRYSY